MENKTNIHLPKIIIAELNPNDDMDIIRHMEKITNEQSYIKQLIRYEIARQRSADPSVGVTHCTR